MKTHLFKFFINISLTKYKIRKFWLQSTLKMLPLTFTDKWFATYRILIDLLSEMIRNYTLVSNHFLSDCWTNTLVENLIQIGERNILESQFVLIIYMKIKDFKLTVLFSKIPGLRDRTCLISICNVFPPLTIKWPVLELLFKLL